MLSSHITRRLQAGFSLITASIVISVAALVFVSMLPGDNKGAANQKIIDNTNKLERIEEAMRSFEAAQGRLPCPADGQYAFNTANFGTEAANQSSCTGGTPAAPLGPDAGTGNIVGGVIPVKTLALPDDYAVDAFGHRFGYVVDKRATKNTTCLTLTTGGINIKSTTGGTLLAQVMHAYISFGASGYGAYPYNGLTSPNTGPAYRINSGSTDTDMQTNAGVNSSFTYSTSNFTNTLVQKSMVAPTASDTGFDDMVWYRKDMKSTCALGPLGGVGGVGSNACSTSPLTGGDWGSISKVTIGSPISAYMSAGNSTCTAHSLACVSGSPNSLTCDGSGTLTNCEFSACSQTCSLSANQGGGTLNGTSPGNTASEYITNTVTSPTTCPAALTLTCTNGVLSCSDGVIGDCAYSSCVQTPPGCSTSGLTSFSPPSMTSGQNLNGYVDGGDINCTVHTLNCNSGTLTCDGSGTLTNCEYSSCAQGCSTASLTSFSPATMTSGQSLNGYATNAGSVCTASSLLCTNGALTCAGSGTLTNCEFSSCSTGGTAVSVWVADTDNNRLQGYNSNGAWQMTIPGSGCSGWEPACANSTSNGQFTYPQGVAEDSNGNLWVTENGTNRVQEINSTGTYQMGIGAGYNGVAGAIGSSGYTNGQFDNPFGIAIDTSNNIWVADVSNNRLQKFSSLGTWLLTVPGGCANSAIPACAVSAASGHFTAPNGIDIDTSGNLWVVDTSNSRVQKISNTGTWLLTVGSSGTGTGNLSSPYGMAFTSTGNLWVTDTTNRRLEEFSNTGTYLAQYGASGSGNGQFYAPNGVAVDISGNIWAVDENNHRVEKFSGTGTFLAGIGAGYQGVPVGTGFPTTTGALNGQFYYPQGIAVPTGASTIWVADAHNNRIEEFSTTGTWLLTIPSGCADSAYPACAASSTNGHLTFPLGITTDPSGNVYVGDEINNRVQKFNSSGVYQGAIGAGYNGVGGTVGSTGYLNGQFDLPYGVALDSNGNIWVADMSNNRVQEFNGSTLAWIQTFPGGCADSALPGCAVSNTNGKFSAPVGITIDSNGNLWVSDRGNNRVEELSSTGTFLAGIGAGYNGVAGSIGASGYLNGQFNLPIGITLDSSNNLWVTDVNNNREQKFSSSGTWLLTIPGGCADSATPACATGTGTGKFNVPEGVAIDRSGNVWVTDMINYRVQEFSSTGTYMTKFGSGSSSDYTNGQFGGAGDPEGIAIH